MVSSTDTLYHYLLSREAVANLDAILRDGLLPLSAWPQSERWMAIERERPGIFEELYHLFAGPLLDLAYRHSGIFLTPIDFRRTVGSALHRLPRIAIPLGAIDARTAALTYTFDGRRVVRAVTVQDLEETARLFTAARIRQWFARDPSMMFFHVPQVAAYPDGAIPIHPEWVER